MLWIVSERARSRTRVAAGTLLVTGVVFVYAACGLSVSATGGGEGTDGAVGGDGGGPSLPDGAARNDGGDAAQGGCAAGEEVCGERCSDLKIDPLNCGACGKTCAGGQTCEERECTVLCVADKAKCSDTCVDLATDPRNCGVCGKGCTSEAPLCANKICVRDCVSPLVLCGVADAGADAGGDAGGTGYCADEKNDRNNCGACGLVCKQNEVCSAGTCTPVCVTSSRIGDVFDPTMVGCVATVAFAQRANVCPAGSKVCSGQEWVDRRGAGVPTFNYWTNDDLRYAGSDGNCTASNSFGTLCGRFTATPMRVCGKRTDQVGNSCRWVGCGFGNSAQNRYFGGCEGNTSAGALCCKP